MITTDRFTRTCCVPLMLILVACGDDAQPAASAEAPADPLGQLEPWERLPPDSIYGATPQENVATREIILDVGDLPEGWEGMRIAAISDLQLGLWEGNEAVAAAAVRAAVAAEPDLIVLLGDYIAEGRDVQALARVLAPLRGRQVLAVLGDRDVRSDSLEAAITRTLQASGVTVLRNEAATITRNGTAAAIAGVDPDLADDSWGDQEYILATLGAGAETPLLLMHHPPLISRAPEGKFGAALAGNTFCGPVEVPGTPRLRWLQDEALPGAAAPGTDRLFVAEGTVMYVTCGVGYGFIPTRFGGQPEVALVTLRSAAQTVEAAGDTAGTAAADSAMRAAGGGGAAPGDTAR